MEPTIPLLPILLFTNEGDTVFDPYAGAGTSLRTAILLGRKGMGVEIEQKNLDLMNRHLSDVCKLMDPKMAELVELHFKNKSAA